ncbi:hypothetical protein [Catenulispora rubra]|uniref:hypothetical protein n=1 Tax=Catenulispora rubra TaxID=280293 RepID=UPI00189262D1|nr:hypothetical protein [Catenulispora rubra]
MRSVRLNVTVPPAVTALAEQRALGARKAVFWRRAAPALLLWPITVVVVALAVTLGLLGWHGPALILIAVLLVGISLWRYGGDAECVVVYEHGLACCIGRQLRSVRWDEALYSWRGKADMAIMPQKDALEVTGASDTPDLTGPGGRILLRRYSGIYRMLQLVDAELQPRAFARGQARLAAGGQADFPPMAVTAAGVFVNPGKGTIHAPWAAIDSYTHVGGVIVVSAFVNDAAKGRIAKQWFQGLVADATAADWLMDATNPDPGTPAAEKAAELLAEDIADDAAEVGKRWQKHRRQVVLQGAAFAAVVIGGAAITTIHLPTHGLGYTAACSGHGASRAAAYVPGGGGPHPIDFEGGSGGFAGVSDNAGVLDGEYVGWAPAKATDVQLVACVTGVQTDTLLANCVYVGGASVPMDLEKYTISVWAARTGAQVLAPREIDGDDSVCPDTITTVNGRAPSEFYSTLSLTTVQSAVAAAVTN